MLHQEASSRVQKARGAKVKNGKRMKRRGKKSPGWVIPALCFERPLKPFTCDFRCTSPRFCVLIPPKGQCWPPRSSSPMAPWTTPVPRQKESGAMPLDLRLWSRHRELHSECRGRTQGGALGPGLAELIPSHLLLSIRRYLCVPACRRDTEIIHCVVCSCAGRLKSRCLGTDCFPGCLHTLWNKQVERGEADPQGLHFCHLITCLMKITYAAYR